MKHQSEEYWILLHQGILLHTRFFVAQDYRGQTVDLFASDEGQAELEIQLRPIDGIEKAEQKNFVLGPMDMVREGVQSDKTVS